MACKGVDLTHPQWLLTRANEGELEKVAKSDPPGQPELWTWPVDMILEPGRDFWKQVERKLAVGSLGAETPYDPGSEVRGDFEREQEAVEKLIFGGVVEKEKLWLAVAFPYGAPPLVRKMIYKLFDMSPNYALEKRLRRSAVEAPVALAVRGVQRGVIGLDAPSRVLLLTGGAPSLELTGAKLSRQDGTLLIEIEAYSAVGPDDLPGALGRLGGAPPHDLFLHAGLPAEAARIAPSPVDLGRHAVAAGAILYGGRATEQRQNWVGNQVRAIEVKRWAPAATGVLGTNGQGEWFWRRVLDRGAPLTTGAKFAGLRAGASVPDLVALAECPNPEFAARRWLCQKDWADAGLRWHDVIENADKPADWDLQYKIGPGVQQWNRLAYQHWKVVARG